MSPHTVARDLRVLKRLFNFAIEFEYIETNPCTKVRPPKADERDYVLLTDEQLDALLDACGENDMLRTYVVVLAETGMRANEALHLKWEDVDFAAGYVKIVTGRDGHRTKSGKSRWVLLEPRLDEALREHAARHRLATYDGKRSPWVFHHTFTRRPFKAGARIKSIRTAFDNAVKEAKLPAGFRRHDLRHRRATTWIDEGRSLAFVKEALGHASIATTMRYMHLVREHLKALGENSGGAHVRKAFGT